MLKVSVLSPCLKCDDVLHLLLPAFADSHLSKSSLLVLPRLFGYLRCLCLKSTHFGPEGKQSVSFLAQLVKSHTRKRSMMHHSSPIVDVKPCLTDPLFTSSTNAFLKRTVALHTAIQHSFHYKRL